MMTRISKRFQCQHPRLENLALINDKLTQMLRCPKDRSALASADADLVERTNRAIAAGKLVNLAGQKLQQKLDGGLVREANDLMYPVIDEIPVMLPDEAIELSQLEQR